MNFRNFLLEGHEVVIDYETKSIADTLDAAKKQKVKAKIVSSSVVQLKGLKPSIVKLLGVLGVPSEEINDYFE